MTKPSAGTVGELVERLKKLDWGQVVMNGGPPCFHQEEDGYDDFCLRAERWAGHERGGRDAHKFLSLADFVAALASQEAQPDEAKPEWKAM